MKHLLLTAIAAVVLVGCGPSVPDISIHDAAIDGNIEAVKQHLAAGTDVNATESKFPRNTPLHSAVMYDRRNIDGLLELAELLIAGGADVNAEDDEWRTPLHRAASAGRKEIAELLIAKGADVKIEDIFGQTPLHHAARFHKEIVELLIAKGANVNALIMSGRYQGQTPLDKAGWETADLLRKHGGKTGEELKAEGK